MSTPQQSTVKQQKWERAVISKLFAEGLLLTSDWKQIELCLSRVVAPTRCLAIARQLIGKQRNSGGVLYQFCTTHKSSHKE